MTSPERGPPPQPPPAQLPGERPVQAGAVEGAEHRGAEQEVLLLLLRAAAAAAPLRRQREAVLAALSPLGLVPPVLEPDLDLGLGEPQAGGQLSSLRSRQVLLVVELLLEFEDLQVREGGAGTLLFPRGGEAAVVLLLLRVVGLRARWSVCEREGGLDQT